ncbi:subtilisin-like protease 2 [Plasmodium sp. gorilla clade G3]|nr:subtilisin-like protease 2 [Plasmodium sp. gorilla clade G3]
MLNAFYVISLILIKFIFYKECNNNNFLSNIELYNYKLRKKNRILNNNINDKKSFLSDLEQNYKPLFDIYEISANFEKRRKDLEKKTKEKEIEKDKDKTNENEKENDLEKEYEDVINLLELSLSSQNKDAYRGISNNDNSGPNENNEDTLNKKNSSDNKSAKSFDELIKGEILKLKENPNMKNKNNLDYDKIFKIIKQKTSNNNSASNKIKKGDNEKLKEEKIQSDIPTKVEIKEDVINGQLNKHVPTKVEIKNDMINRKSNKEDNIDKEKSNSLHNFDALNKEKNIITKVYDHYTIVTNSKDILNDISIDASDISKNSIGGINIPYNENDNSSFTHQRYIVISNNGEKKYKIVLMTKNPKFIDMDDIYDEEEKKESLIELNQKINKEENPNLYDGTGTLYYGNKSKKEKENLQQKRGNDSNVDIRHDNNNNNNNIMNEKEMNYNNNNNNNKESPSMFRRFINFLSFSSSENETEDTLIYQRKNDNAYQNKKEQTGKNNHNNDLNNKERILLNVDKLVDQYLLNLKNNQTSKQELILVLKGELDLHSENMKNIIKNAKKNLEKYFKEHFKEVDKISYDISTPINFLCIFIPTVFDMNNMDLLKQALLILHNDLHEYVENWSFSSTYHTYEADYINEQDSVDDKSPKKKYIKASKKLYNNKYSFLNKILSFEPIMLFAKKLNSRRSNIEKEILNFLPKELRDYSTWNLSIIRVFNAWFLAGYGNKNVKVCVVDSGADVNHVDLNGNLYIPDYNEKYEMTEDFYNFMVKNPKDSSGHGTHVTGIIGGVANDLGVVGVAPNITLISLRFIDGKKYGGSFHAIKALNVCILNKAPIINASWGSSHFDVNLHLAVERLKYTLNGKGSVLIAASGNKSNDNDISPLYPATYSFPHVYSVASISRNFEISPFSNYGHKSVHILAPGHHIYSTIPNNAYKIFTGTSMAAPHVCGVSALVYSVCYNQGFIPQAEEVLDILTRTSIKIISSKKRTINDSLVNAEGAVLTTLLGGLWMQMDCYFVKFNLEKGKKKHIPVVFSAYKKGIYETDIVIAIIPIDRKSKVYGEIHIPIKIVTDVNMPNFQESPRRGKIYNIDSSEAHHDEVLSYICENALYNLYEYDSHYLFASVILFFLALLSIFIGMIYMKSRKHSDEKCSKNLMRSSYIPEMDDGKEETQQLQQERRQYFRELFGEDLKKNYDQKFVQDFGEDFSENFGQDFRQDFKLGSSPDLKQYSNMDFQNKVQEPERKTVRIIINNFEDRKKETKRRLLKGLNYNGENVRKHDFTNASINNNTNNFKFSNNTEMKKNTIKNEDVKITSDDNVNKAMTQLDDMFMK